jgi:3-hydroxyisobutyrate dehydrogenase-like beta-hydroxyacid dehydrogenase
MNVSIFGLGIIGSIWAEHFRRDGFEVRGWNRSPKSASYFTPDARSAARDADALLIVVADPPAVQSVLDQIQPVLHAPQLVIQSSTISPEASRQFAAQVEATGAAFLEAPFTGSKPGAEQRKLIFYCGGEPDVMARARPVLQRLATGMELVGPVGSASALKLAMNMNIALVAEALCESLAFARAAGISDERFFATLKLNVSHSGVAALKESKLLAGDFSPQFALKHQAKDLRLALGAAGNLTMPQTRALTKLCEAGVRAGLGEDDFIGLVRLLEKSAAS